MPRQQLVQCREPGGCLWLFQQIAYVFECVHSSRTPVSGSGCRVSSVFSRKLFSAAALSPVGSGECGARGVVCVCDAVSKSLSVPHSVFLVGHGPSEVGQGMPVPVSVPHFKCSVPHTCPTFFMGVGHSSACPARSFSGCAPLTPL